MNQLYLPPMVMFSLLLPLVSGVLTGLFCQRESTATRIGVTAMLISSVASLLSLVLFFSGDNSFYDVSLFSWIAIGDFNCEMGLWIDGLSIVMMFMVSSISFLVHWYSSAYMQDDSGYIRFFSLISLFTFAMLQLVMTNNLLGLFFGWEGVSLFSYLLIGFHYAKDSAATANLKAFLINRFGDISFCLGIALLILSVGSFQYNELFNRMSDIAQDTTFIPGIGSVHRVFLIGLLLFIGAMTKSAQMPLHIWLPDSMEGPTPVSALIHAATMVTAGVFLLCRFADLIVLTPVLMNCIAFIGASSALWLGIIALFEFDIKRVIAYSTLSQLGYMILAVGVGVFNIAIFHLLLHAVYKALLFLAAGSVIHALAHQQDIRQMGGLWTKMPITAICFLVGALSLSGIPPFSGFYSKDLILLATAKQMGSFHLGWYIYGCALLGFLVTPLYIFRVFWVVFLGAPRYVTRTPVYESPLQMLGPLLILSVLSLVAGYCFLPFFAGESSFFQFPALSSSLQPLQQKIVDVVNHGLFYHAVFGLGIYLAFLGVLVSWLRYHSPNYSSQWTTTHTWWLSWPFVNRYGFDWCLEKVITPLFIAGSMAFYRYGEQAVNQTVEYQVAGRIQRLSNWFSRQQTSYLNRYFAVMSLAIVLMLAASFIGYRII